MEKKIQNILMEIKNSNTLITFENLKELIKDNYETKQIYMAGYRVTNGFFATLQVDNSTYDFLVEGEDLFCIKEVY